MRKNRSVSLYGITGIILANNWDENGNVTGVSVYTDREEIYIVAPNRQIKALVSLIHTKVRLAGEIKEGSRGNTLFYVKSFKTEE